MLTTSNATECQRRDERQHTSAGLGHADQISTTTGAVGGNVIGFEQDEVAVVIVEIAIEVALQVSCDR